MEKQRHDTQEPDANPAHADTDHRMQQLIKKFLRIYENTEVTSADSVEEYGVTYPQIVQYAKDIVAHRRHKKKNEN